ncbi:VC0807 family protein [Ornithinimicrobium cryptoxanthini]|uniref:Intracellular septation protein A n=1 Tax=Ornithinimicrobium cryptoxanthini TaxID=2934161 RepID=A0ABY4YHQ3_9MICO|nr:VC0807 family protein [Ornithinimicrobium cryptoxanthini]USQ76291.1 hypothetical protein NF557_17160 [Ornithinimicrobium cryptoxanthini]
MTGEHNDAPAGRNQPTSWLAAFVAELVLDVGLGLGTYWIARAAGWEMVHALVLGGAVAGLRAGWTALRSRTVDTFLVMVVLSFLLTVTLSWWSGDARVFLLKSAATAGLFAVVAGASLFWGRPLLFFIVRRFVAPGQAGRAEWDLLWEESSPFRWLHRRITAVWAVTYLVATAGQIVTILLVAVEVSVPVLRTASPALTVFLVAWTAWYTARAERSLDRPLLDSEITAPKTN